MKRLIKIEKERLLSSKTFYITMLIGIIIAVSQFIIEVIPASQDLLKAYSGVSYTLPSVFKKSMSLNTSSPFRMVYLITFPILAMMPFALTYCSDLKTGYVKNIYTRELKEKYLLSKFIVTFVSGGMAVIFPVILNIMLTMTVLPVAIPVQNGTFAIMSKSFMCKTFYSNPFLYVFVYLIIIFAFGGIFATLILAFTRLIQNVFLLSLSTFVLWYMLDQFNSMVKDFIDFNISCETLVDMIQRGPVHSVWNYVFVGAFWLVISVVLFFSTGMKSDTY